MKNAMELPDLPQLSEEQQTYVQFVADHPGASERDLITFFPDLDKLRYNHDVRKYIAIGNVKRLREEKHKKLNSLNDFHKLKQDLWPMLEKYIDQISGKLAPGEDRVIDEIPKFAQTLFLKIYAGELKYFEKTGELYATFDFATGSEDKETKKMILEING